MRVYFPCKTFIKTGRWRIDKEFTYLPDKGISSSPVSDLRLPKGVEGLITKGGCRVKIQGGLRGI